MKVLVTGASGAIGTQLIPRLVDAGHTVVGITTSPEKREMLRGLGAEPVVADVLDAEGIGSVVAAASPDAIIHEATALSGDFDFRHIDRFFAVTNRIRREGTDNLLAAGRAAGIRRFVAQSFARMVNRADERSAGDRGRTRPRHRPAAAGGGGVSGRDHAISRRPSAGSSGPTASFSGTGVSTGRERASRSIPPRPRSRRSRSGSSRSSETAPASGRSSTSPMPPTQPSRRSNREPRASTTSSTTTRPPPAIGCPQIAARGRREAAAAGPEMARKARRRGAGPRHDVRRERVLEREGEARARLDAGSPELALPRSGGASMSAPRTERYRPKLRRDRLPDARRGRRGQRTWFRRRYLRLHRQSIIEGERIESPEAYLVTLVTRLSIDELRSARSQREVYVGEWLPEPLVADTRADPRRERRARRVAVALVRRRPRDADSRAAGGVPAPGRLRLPLRADRRGARQAARRDPPDRNPGATARRRAQAAVRDATSEKQEALASRFFAAVTEGEVGELEALLAGDVELHGDGGGKAPALARAISGRSRVARTLINWGKTVRRGGIRIEPRTVNGNPGAVFTAADGALISVIELEFAGTEIRSVHGIVNPDKLGSHGPGGRSQGAAARRPSRADMSAPWPSGSSRGCWSTSAAS